MLYESPIFAHWSFAAWVQLHPLTHAQFINKAHRSETKIENGVSASDHPQYGGLGTRLVNTPQVQHNLNVH